MSRLVEERLRLGMVGQGYFFGGEWGIRKGEAIGEGVGRWLGGLVRVSGVGVGLLGVGSVVGELVVPLGVEVMVSNLVGVGGILGVRGGDYGLAVSKGLVGVYNLSGLSSILGVGVVGGVVVGDIESLVLSLREAHMRRGFVGGDLMERELRGLGMGVMGVVMGMGVVRGNIVGVANQPVVSASGVPLVLSVVG